MSLHTREHYGEVTRCDARFKIEVDSKLPPNGLFAELCLVNIIQDCFSGFLAVDPVAMTSVTKDFVNQHNTTLRRTQNIKVSGKSHISKNERVILKVRFTFEDYRWGFDIVGEEGEHLTLVSSGHTPGIETSCDIKALPIQPKKQPAPQKKNIIFRFVQRIAGLL